MVKKKGTALLVVLTDVGPEHDAEFNSWYNEEHLPERLSAPGFLDAAGTRRCAAAPDTWPSTSWSQWTRCTPRNTCV